MSRYLFLVLFLSVFVCSMAQEACFYSLYIQTGDQGTTSNISAVLSGNGSSLSIDSLKEFGLQGPDFSYFQANQTDSFYFVRACLEDVFNLTVISDGSGSSPNWFLDTAGLFVFKVEGFLIVPFPFLTKIFPFKTLLSPPDSLTASAIATEGYLRSAGVPHGVSRA